MTNYRSMKEALEALKEAGFTNTHPLKNHAAFRYIEDRLTAKAVSPEEKPIPMLLQCPKCCKPHIDEGEYATKPHHTHSCQHCGLNWRPALVHTVGVAFLPGFKNDEEKKTVTFNNAFDAAQELEKQMPSVKSWAAWGSIKRYLDALNRLNFEIPKIVDKAMDRAKPEQPKEIATVLNLLECLIKAQTRATWDRKVLEPLCDAQKMLDELRGMQL